MDEIKTIEKLLERNKTKEAISNIEKLLRYYYGNDYYDQLIHLKAELNDIRKKEIINILSEDELIRFRNGLRFRILELLKELKYELKKQTVFISYSHYDKSFAEDVKKVLENNNIKVIIDSKYLKAGQSIKEFTEKSILNSGYTVSIISNKSLLSGWVGVEQLNTIYFEKFIEKDRLIACYIDADFIISEKFVEDTIQKLNERIKKTNETRIDRIKKGISTKDLDEVVLREDNLKNNIPLIINRLKEGLCLNINDENLSASMNKLINSIKGL